MTRLERLIQRWNSDEVGRKQLGAFLNSDSGETFLAILSETAVSTQVPIADMTNLDIAAQRFAFQSGVGNCIGRIDRMPDGIDIEQADPNLSEWGWASEVGKA